VCAMERDCEALVQERVLLLGGLARRPESAENELARKRPGSVTCFEPVQTPTVQT